MAVAFLGRVLIPKQSFSSLTSRFISTSLSGSELAVVASSRSPLLRLRPLIALSEFHRVSSAVVGLRAFSSRPTTSSLNDPSPNWNNRPPKETILLDGCDFEHWLIVLEKPEGDPTRDEIIDSYIKTLATVLGSEEEARKNIYSVSTRHYFAFGALVSEEISYKIKELPNVRWVLPDSYLDVRNKDYGGEPFIDGQAVPYDPKYHEEWVRNNARANERSRRNDRPRNFDRSRNFERRRENMQSRDGPPPNMGGMQGPPPNMGGMQGPPPNMGGVQGPPPNMGGVQGPPPNMGGVQGPPPNMGGMQGPPPNMGGMQGPPPNMGGMPPNRGMPQNAYSPGPAANMGGMPQNSYSQNSGPGMGGSPQNSYSQNPGPNMGGMPPMHNSPPNMGGMPPNPSMQNNGPYMGGMPNRDAGPNAGYSNQMPNAGNGPNRDFQYNNNNTGGGMPYQNRDAPQVPHNAYTPNRDMGGQPGGNVYQVRDIPGRDMPPPNPNQNRDY